MVNRYRDRNKEMSGLLRSTALLAVGLLVLPVFAAAAGDAPADSAAAKAVFETSGIKAGLCIHLGCGRPETSALTAALAEGSEMLVHGLALDDAALGRARQAIETRGVPGRAMTEKLVEKALPYLSDMASLAVVEDMAALTAQGITREEILRVLSPGGVLCVKDSSHWNVSTKPRPKEMDEWSHPHHGPDGNLVSTDKVLTFPIGCRWIDGVPVNMGSWGSCRAVVLAGGRCFTVSVNDMANLNSKTPSIYLAARDAYCGFPLWKMSCETNYAAGAALDWRNVWPLVATDRRVYTMKKDSLVILDAATGKVETTCPTKYPTRRLLLMNGVLVAAGWEKIEQSKGGYEGDDLRGIWWPVGAGCVDAFDAESGKPKWSLPLAALEVLASDGVVYLLTHTGNPPTAREIVALDLSTGKEKWRIPHTAFGTDADITLSLAGPECAVVSKTKIGGKREVFVLSAADGKTLCTIPGATARSIVGGELWCGDGRYDLKTGQKVNGEGIGAPHVSGNGVGGCVPSIVVGGRFITASRGGHYVELPQAPAKVATLLSYQGARGGCILGMVPANGMFYTAQNSCQCVRGQIGGFLGIGPCGALATPEEFEKPRPVEKGPAFGAAAPSTPSVDEWPTYRHDAERSAGAASKIPNELKMLWTVQCAKPGEGQFEEAWRCRLGLSQPLTAPTLAAGMLFVAKINSGQVLSLEPTTGKTLWTTMLGSRIDTPPTIHNGICLVGCHDGWVYALRAKDGVLAYRMRIAPRERRMVAHGLVESVWPATGAVLVHDGIAYATAGRTTESDGGIAVVAFKPETGETVWARVLEKNAIQNDILSVQNGELAWHWLRMDLKTGKSLPSVQSIQYHGGMIDGSWAAGFGLRSGRGFILGKFCASMMAWNSQLAASQSYAVHRSSVDVPKPPANAPMVNPADFKREDIVWSPALEPENSWARVHAMSLAGNAALFAGSVFTYGEGDKYSGSFLWINSIETGKKQQATIKLDSPVGYDGLIVSGDRVYLSLQSGALVCFGK